MDEGNSDLNWKAKLRHALMNFFGLDEIHLLFFDIGLDHEEFSTDTKTTAVVEIIDAAMRNEKIEDLIKACEQMRPNVKWKEIAKEAKNETQRLRRIYDRPSGPPIRSGGASASNNQPQTRPVVIKNPVRWIIGVVGLLGSVFVIGLLFVPALADVFRPETSTPTSTASTIKVESISTEIASSDSNDTFQIASPTPIPPSATHTQDPPPPTQTPVTPPTNTPVTPPTHTPITPPTFTPISPPTHTPITPPTHTPLPPPTHTLLPPNVAPKTGPSSNNLLPIPSNIAEAGWWFPQAFGSLGEPIRELKNEDLYSGDLLLFMNSIGRVTSFDKTYNYSPACNTEDGIEVVYIQVFFFLDEVGASKFMYWATDNWTYPGVSQRFDVGVLSYYNNAPSKMIEGYDCLLEPDSYTFQEGNIVYRTVIYTKDGDLNWSDSRSEASAIGAAQWVIEKIR